MAGLCTRVVVIHASEVGQVVQLGSWGRGWGFCGSAVGLALALVESGAIAPHSTTLARSSWAWGVRSPI
jgi:hypothetical protein